jgi:hypothetical protein
MASEPTSIGPKCLPFGEKPDAGVVWAHFSGSRLAGSMGVDGTRLMLQENYRPMLQEDDYNSDFDPESDNDEHEAPPHPVGGGLQVGAAGRGRSARERVG